MERIEHEVAVHIAAPNDVNGNPQRGWIISGSYVSGVAIPLSFVDEGYRGSAALEDCGFHGIPRTGYMVQVTQAEYRKWNRGIFCPVASTR